MSSQSSTIVLPVTNMGTASNTGTYKSLGDSQPNQSTPGSGKATSEGGQALPVQSQRDQRDTADVEKIIQKLNAVSLSIGRDLRFQVNLKTGKSTIQVLDSDTGEIIRQIPAEKVSSYIQSEGNLAIRLFDEHV